MMDMTINHLELNGDECRVSVDGKHLQFDNYEIANDVYDILAQMQKETILLELKNDKLKKRNKELEYHLNRTGKELPKDKNGYTKIVCPMCGSNLKYSRFIGYMNGEQYEEFDCTQCDFTGRIRKGNLWDDLE